MNYNEAFEALQRETKVELEDPMLSQLHHVLVELGDYKAAEDFMEHALASEFGKHASWTDCLSCLLVQHPRPDPPGGRPMS